VIWARSRPPSPGCSPGPAAAATLLDLAARHVIEIEAAGPQLSLCRIIARDGDGLAPYEWRILSYLEALASGGEVPAPALAAGPAQPDGWWRRLRREVAADARDRGLSRPRWNPALAPALGLLAGLPGACLAVFLARLSGAGPTLTGQGIAGCAAVAAVLGGALVRRLNTDRLTPAGAAAAGRWLGVRAYLAADRSLPGQPPAAVSGYGRLLAYGAAFGLARTAIESLPVGQAADPHMGWSTYGTGRWHPVEISYPRRPGWGRAPRPVLLTWLLRAVPPAALAALFLAVIPGVPVIGWIALALAAAALGVAARAAADLAGGTAVEGEVVRTRAGGASGGQVASSRYWIAVDDGTGPAVQAWRVGAAVYRMVNEGDVIRVRVSRIFRYVSGLQVITDHPRPDVEAALPAAQRREDDAGHSPALLAGVTALTGGAAPGLDPAALITAADAATLLGVPVAAPQALDPLGQIPGAAANPVSRMATLSACRWPAADGSGRSADVFCGPGLGARSLIGMLLASHRRTAGPGRRLGTGVILAGNVLIVTRHGTTAAVVLNGVDPQLAGPLLERLIPAVTSRAGTSSTSGTGPASPASVSPP
jgi:Predicted membrane protein (DUF2207)